MVCHPEPVRFAQGKLREGSPAMGSGCFPFAALRAGLHSLNMTCPTPLLPILNGKIHYRPVGSRLIMEPDVSRPCITSMNS